MKPSAIVCAGAALGNHQQLHIAAGKGSLFLKLPVVPIMVGMNLARDPENAEDANSAK